MTKAMVFVMTLMFFFPSHASAQANASPGDRIRIRERDGTVLIGTLLSASGETIELSSDSSRIVVPVERIDALERRTGDDAGQAVAVTVGIAAVIGAVIGVSQDTCPGSCFAIGPDSRLGNLTLGFFGGAILGLPLGALFAAAASGERWRPVTLPVSAESGFTIRPMMGNRVGFAASVRVGGM